MDEGRELLVAASFALHAREAVAAGRFGNQRKRWLTYCRLYKKVMKGLQFHTFPVLDVVKYFYSVMKKFYFIHVVMLYRLRISGGLRRDMATGAPAWKSILYAEMDCITRFVCELRTWFCNQNLFRCSWAYTSYFLFEQFSNLRLPTLPESELSIKLSTDQAFYCTKTMWWCLRLLVDQQDQFDRSLPTFIQLLDLSDSERDDYWKVMGMVEQGEEVDLFVDDPTDNERNALGSGSSTTTRLNNKVSSLYLFKLPNKVLLSLPTSEQRAILDPNYYPSPEQVHKLHSRQISMHCRSMALLNK